MNELLNNATAITNIAAFLCLFAGVVINVLYDVQTRYIESLKSPVSWDWKFFWNHNKWRFGINLLMAVFVVYLFTDITGIPLNKGICFMTGLCFDAMYVVYRKLRKRFVSIIDKHLGGY